MKIGENSRLVIEAGDGLTFRFLPSPNVRPGALTPAYLIIHATEGPDVEAAINTFKSVSGGTSAHLVLGRDGVDLVQMVEFNRRAQHANEYNPKALGIELDYTGHLTEDPSAHNHFSHISKFQPDEIIYAEALNDRGHLPTRIRPWPRYPKAQLDALVPIARLLVNQFGLQIVGHEEIKNFKLDPGPAFPMTLFKEIVHGNTEGSVLYDQIDRDLDLRTGPGLVFPALSGGRLTAGTLVFTTYDHDGWGLVEVMDGAGGNSWLVGWTPLDSIIARQATPVVIDHKLFTTDGRQYQFVEPHPNNYSPGHKLIEPKYLIMHTTDGIAVESTINAFRSADHGASAHLLIGRDGRVVQFVDFDTIAFHCGYSYWEEDSDLNRFSIGIEVDNGASLSHTDGVWKWKTTIIPDEDVQEARHWKRNSKQGWQTFTDVQIKVMREIVQVLQEKYGFQVILGHDVINIPEREDPGPLFPIEDLREFIFGQPGAVVKSYQVINETKIYKNYESQKPPDLDHPQFAGNLPAKTRVTVLVVKEDWTRIKVKAETGPFRGTEGWIRNDAVNPTATKPKTSKDSPYFKLNPRALAQAPWTLSRLSPFPVGTCLRIEKFEDRFALVVSLDPVRGTYVEGWVEQEDIAPAGEERIPYPPVVGR